MMKARPPVAARAICTAYIQGLRAATGHLESREGIRVERHQPLRVLHDDLARIATVDVQCGSLASHGLDDAWMTVPRDRHVVVDVHVAAAVGAVEPDAFASHQRDRRLVENRSAQPHRPIAPAHQVEAVGHSGSSLPVQRYHSRRLWLKMQRLTPDTYQVTIHLNGFGGFGIVA